MPNPLPSLLVAVLLSGCGSLLPSERQQSASVKATEALATQQSLTIQRALSTGLEQATRISPNGSIITTPLQEQLSISSSTTSNAGSRSSEWGAFAQTIPWGVKLLLLAAGLFALIAVVWLLRRSSAAANATYTAFDSALAGLTNQVASLATTSTDPSHKALLTTLLAATEKARGKANSEIP